MEERVAVVIYDAIKVSNLDDFKAGWLTVKVLAVQLLYELEHHTICSTFPQIVSRGETFGPCRFSTIVLCMYCKIKFAHKLIHQGVIFRYTVQSCNDRTSLRASASTKKMAAGQKKMSVLCINRVTQGHTEIPARRRPQTTVSTPREAGDPQELAKKPSS